MTVPLILQKGNEEEIAKYSKRTVRVTREHNEDCRRLLRLMGVPIVDVRPCTHFLTGDLRMP